VGAGSVTRVNATRRLDYPEHVPPRRRASDDHVPEANAANAREAAAAAGKGRPTPKRREAEAAHRRPLVPTRAQGARGNKANKAKERARREREYQAMLTGEERYLPLRDKGPVRRWVRDYVDARRNPGEYFLPVSLVIVLASLFTAGNPVYGLLIIAVLYLIVLITVIDAFLLGNRIRKRLIAKFGADKLPRGIRMYGVMRAFQMRRTRLPKPQVKRGEYPR
jgi:hypothetical protein